MRFIDKITRSYRQAQPSRPLPEREEIEPGIVTNRAQRRAAGFRGKALQPHLSVIQRYVRRHYLDGMFDKYGPAVYTRRQRRHRARIIRAMKARGL